MIFVSKWFLNPVEYTDNKITIWPPDNISLIYTCWVTNVETKTQKPKPDTTKNDGSLTQVKVATNISDLTKTQI